MPDLEDVEKEAQSHSTQVDEVINKGDQELDKKDGGRDAGLVDKVSQEAEKDIGAHQDDGNPGGQ